MAFRYSDPQWNQIAAILGEPVTAAARPGLEKIAAQFLATPDAPTQRAVIMAEREKRRSIDAAIHELSWALRDGDVDYRIGDRDLLDILDDIAREREAVAEFELEEFGDPMPKNAARPHEQLLFHRLISYWIIELGQRGRGCGISTRPDGSVAEGRLFRFLQAATSPLLPEDRHITGNRARHAWRAAKREMFNDGEMNG